MEVGEDRPLPTDFRFNNAEAEFELLGGETLEPEGEVHFDPVFEMEIKYLEGEVSFFALTLQNKIMNLFTCHLIALEKKLKASKADSLFFVRHNYLK